MLAVRWVWLSLGRQAAEERQLPWSVIRAGVFVRHCVNGKLMAGDERGLELSCLATTLASAAYLVVARVQLPGGY